MLEGPTILRTSDKLYNLSLTECGLATLIHARISILDSDISDMILSTLDSICSDLNTTEKLNDKFCRIALNYYDMF